MTYLGRDCKEIPPILVKLYASSATRVDLSFCSLRTLRGLESFTNLQELILDNCQLGDDTSFPALPVVVLSMNKNNVSTPTARHMCSHVLQFEQIDSLLRKLAHAYPNLRFLSLLGNPGCPDQLTRDADDSQYKRYRFVTSNVIK